MKGDILQQYTEARINERLHLFLQFPDLRRSFQEIDRKDLAFQILSPSFTLRAVHHLIIGTRILRNLLKSLTPA